MASSGKKKKTNWKQVSQNNFLEIAGPRKTNWADEVDSDIEDETFDRIIPVLPTAPRASCAVPIDESKVPHSPPFQAYVSNIPYDLTDNELKDLFADLSIKEVRLPKDEKGGNRVKGFGYVEFLDRGSLISALAMGETMLKGRNIHIELATNDIRGGRSRGSQRGDMGSRGDNPSMDRALGGNWRSGPREEVEDNRGGFDRGRREYGSGFSRKDDRSDSFARDDRGGGGGFHRGGERFERGGGGGFGRDRDDRGYNERGFRERDRDRGGFRDDDNFGRRDRDDNRGFGGDDRGSRGGGGGGFGRREMDSGRFPRRDDPPMRERDSQEHKTRPKLNLQPRSSNLPSGSAEGGASQSASIFGNAKPVDTSAKLLEIEERLAKTEFTPSAEKARSTGSTSSGGSTGGGSYMRSEAIPVENKSQPVESKIEPAPPPKENPWANNKKLPPVNNGRSSPHDEVETSPPPQVESEREPSEDPRRGVGRPDTKKVDNRKQEDVKGGKVVKAPQPAAERPKGKEPEKAPPKHREPKKDLEDPARMPKIPDSQTPNFAGSNKFSSLLENEDGGLE